MNRPGEFALTEKLFSFAWKYQPEAPGRALRILDIGCGSGDTLRWLAKQYPHWLLWGIDPAAWEWQEGSVSVRCGRGESLPFTENSFDFVLMECSYSRVQDPEQVRREIRRVLMPEGKLLMSDLYIRDVEGAETCGGAEGDTPRIGRLETAEQIRRDFWHSGFGILELQDVSSVLGDWLAQAILDGRGDRLSELLGADPAGLRRLSLGYFLGTFEVSPLWELTGLAPGDWEGFRALPLMDSEEICRCPEAYLRVPPKEIARIITARSSGTTGRRKRLFFTERDLERTADFFSYGIRWLVQPGDRVAVFMEGNTHYSVGGLLQEALLRIPAEPFVLGFMGDVREAARQAEGMDCLIGVPIQLFLLAQEAPSLRPKTVLLSADYVPESLKQRLEDVWGCRVFTHWGMTETGYGGGVQCSAREGYHLRDEDMLLEILNPDTGEPVEAGTSGEIVVTTLRREGMPLIRYRTGDLGRMLFGPCPCGCLKPRLGKVMGRIEEGILLPEGGVLTIPLLDEALFSLEGLGNAGYLWEEKEERLTVTVETDHKEEADQELLREVRQRVQNLAGERIRVRVESGRVSVTDGVIKRRIIRKQ